MNRCKYHPAVQVDMFTDPLRSLWQFQAKRVLGQPTETDLGFL